MPHFRIVQYRIC